MKKKIDASAAIVLIVAAAFLTFAATFFYMRDSGRKYEKLDEVMDVVERYYVGEYDPQELEEQAAAAMVEALGDGWSYYLGADYLEEYSMELNNEYRGVGITVRRSEEGENLIVEVAEGSPAANAGIMPGDILFSVEGTEVSEPFLFDDIGPLVLDSVAEGTAEFGIVRDGVLTLYELGGATIRLNPVSWEMLGTAGYIVMDNFDARAGDEFIAACDALIAQGAESIVIDLRFNPGGSLHELLDILDHLLPEGDIFLSRVKGGEMVAERSGPECVDMPMAVIVNEYSFSAAEYMAAALQEYEWAVIVGERTSGKSYVQQTQLLSDGSVVHLSVEEYFTPKGVRLEETGVTPDVELYLEDEQWTELYYGVLLPEDDAQLQAALEAVKTIAAE